MRFRIHIAVFLATFLAGCNQPFVPTGPVDNRLVIYCVLSSRTDTQYVRLSSTVGSPPYPDIRNATVTLTGGGSVFSFRDTTVLWQDTAGNFVPTNVYVAYPAPIRGETGYQVQASTPSGLTASASVTSLSEPFFSLQPYRTPGFFALTRDFKSVRGDAVLHFYVDYYVLVNNGWVLKTQEVPSRTYEDAAGNQAFDYPSLGSVPALTGTGTVVQFDSASYEETRSRVVKQYLSAPVVFIDIRFVLAQIDDILYDYYYINNGPADRSSIRLDVPDFTNIEGGYGVFGSRADVILLFPLPR